MQKLAYSGSTSIFYRLRPGVVVKKPRIGWSDPKAEENCLQAINLEQQILKHLGSHENIVPYKGPYEDSGFLLAEASYGSLQAFIDANTDTIDLSVRWKLVLQASKSVAFVHEKGVIHSDLRPANMLVYSEQLVPPGQPIPSMDLTLWLCDFGGAMCQDLGLDGGFLPDDPFFDPRQLWEATPATDIFSLGSIFYNIMTGCWPYWQGPAPKGDERVAYQARVNKLFEEGSFPDVTNVSGGKVIAGCWEHKFKTAQEVVNAVRVETEELDM